MLPTYELKLTQLILQNKQDENNGRFISLLFSYMTLCEQARSAVILCF